MLAVPRTTSGLKNKALHDDITHREIEKERDSPCLHETVLFFFYLTCVVQPSDIEDYTDRFISYFGVEFKADTVKRIHIRDTKEKISEFYLISLIEHKSKVDYNINVQLLKYMTCIWSEYEKQFGADYKDQVKTKEFRYPPILPIVYHEGNDTWTAPMHLKERIFMHEVFDEYIPNFTYFLVNNRDFSTKELLEHKDEMSLIMLLNKIQNKTDLNEFLRIPPEDINRIVRESPETVIDIEKN